MCLKKYCECFQAAVPCSGICTCLSCCNTPGSAHLTATTVSRTSPLQGDFLGLRADSVSSTSSNSSAPLLTGGSSSRVYNQVSTSRVFMCWTLVTGLPQVKAEEEGTSSQRSTLDGFLSHMMGSFEGARQQHAAELHNSGSKPPLAPGKRKREEFGAEGTMSGAPCTPGALERQFYADMESSGLLLADMLAKSVEQLDSGTAETAGSTAAFGERQLTAGERTSIRSASPNSVNIATALSNFAANCFHLYNRSKAAGSGEVGYGSPVPVAFSESPAAVKSAAAQLHVTGSSLSPPGHFALLPQTPDVVVSTAACALQQSDAGLDTSTTSEDTDEDLSQGAADSRREYISHRAAKRQVVEQV